VIVKSGGKSKAMKNEKLERGGWKSWNPDEAFPLTTATTQVFHYLIFTGMLTVMDSACCRGNSGPDTLFLSLSLSLSLSLKHKRNRTITVTAHLDCTSTSSLLESTDNNNTLLKDFA